MNDKIEHLADTLSAAAPGTHEASSASAVESASKGRLGPVGMTVTWVLIGVPCAAFVAALWHLGAPLFFDHAATDSVKAGRALRMLVAALVPCAIVGVLIRDTVALVRRRRAATGQYARTALLASLREKGDRK